ncbi:unnamed protein product [Schistosoma curassoni]|uniref:Uncharacterized protein n=1 Tax=Schistosoma curassoni TaxID=6186 RepID=A0A183JNG8_9TREM|nr:unnamed protein product [Schistosoma curassoni]
MLICSLQVNIINNVKNISHKSYHLYWHWDCFGFLILI